MTGELYAYKSVISRLGSQHVIHRSQHDNQELLIRLADHSDFDHVMEMSKDIYSGMDYMKSKYHWFLDTGKIFMFIMFLDSKPVYFAMQMIQNDYTASGMGGRSALSHRGSGLFTMFQISTRLFIMKIFPGLCRGWSSGIMVRGRQSMLKKSNALSMFRYNDIFFETTNNIYDNCKLLLGRIVSQPHLVPLSDIEATFAQPSVLKRLFPYAQFCVDHSAYIYDVNKENIAIASETNDVLVSYHDEHPTSINAVSFIRGFQAPIGTLLVFYYYGKESLEILTSHVLKSVHAYLEGHRKIKGELRLMLNFPLGILANEVMAFMEKNELGSRERNSRNGPTVCDVSILNWAKEIDSLKNKL